MFLKSACFVSFTDNNFKCLTEIKILSVKMSDTKIQDILHRTRTCLTENYSVWRDVSFCQTKKSGSTCIIGVLQPQQVMTGEMVPCHQHRRPRDLEKAEASVGAAEVVEVLVEAAEVDLVEEAEVDLVEEVEAEVDLVAPKDLAPAIQGALVEDNQVK